MFLSFLLIFSPNIWKNPIILPHSLNHPLRPAWDIRPQQKFEIPTCPVLWPVLCPTYYPSLPALSSLSSARWFFSCLFSSFQMESISWQLWVFCYGGSRCFRASLVHDRAKVVCDFWSRGTYSYCLSSNAIPHSESYWANRYYRSYGGSCYERHQPFSYPLSLSSSTRSHTIGRP